jgi:hypothetical protein
MPRSLGRLHTSKLSPTARLMLQASIKSFGTVLVKRAASSIILHTSNAQVKVGQAKNAVKDGANKVAG